MSIFVAPPITKAIMLSGINDIKTPATGIKPKIQIINPNAMTCGNPSIVRRIVETIAFIVEIKA